MLALHSVPLGSIPSNSITLAFGSVQEVNYQKEKIALCFRLYEITYYMTNPAQMF